MVIEEVSEAIRYPVAACLAPSGNARKRSVRSRDRTEYRIEEPAFLGQDRLRRFGIVQPLQCAILEDVQSVSQIAPADWSALLDHADTINFFGRPERAPARYFDHIFYLAITAGNRTREFATSDPFESPEFARLIMLIRRAVRDRQMLSPDMLNDVQFTAWLDARSANSGDDPSR